MLGRLRQGVQPRIAERADLLQQHCDFGQADLQPGAFAAAGQHLLFAVSLGQQHGLLSLPFGAGEIRVGLQNRASDYRPARSRSSARPVCGPGPVGLALVFGDPHLHLRVGQLGLLGRLAWASLQRSQFLGGGPLTLIGLDLFDRTTAVAAIVPAAIRSCRRLRPCPACRSARPRIRCRTRRIFLRSSRVPAG